MTQNTNVLTGVSKYVEKNCSVFVCRKCAVNQLISRKKYPYFYIIRYVCVR